MWDENNSSKPLSIYDPKTFRGVWHAIHLLGKASKSTKSRGMYVQAIIEIASNLGCEKCQQHAQVFLAQNDISSLLNDENEYALFDYTVRFHNHANRLTGKSEMPLEVARKLYYSSEKKGCDSDSHSGCSTVSIAPRLVRTQISYK